MILQQATTIFLNVYIRHCVNCVQIRSLFWSVFSRIRTEYGEIVFLRIQSECGKIRTRKNSVSGHLSCSESLIQCLDCRFLVAKFLLLKENTRKCSIHKNLLIGILFRYIVIYLYVYNLHIYHSFLMAFLIESLPLL